MIQWDVIVISCDFSGVFVVLYNAIQPIGGAVVEITMMAIIMVIFTPLFIGIWGPMVKSIAL